MNIEQLSIFSEKAAFNKDDFEHKGNMEAFRSLAVAVTKAFDKFTEHDITFFDATCRSTMLNCFVVAMVEEMCSSDQLKFVKSLTNTRRGFGLLNNEYIILFKKYPVTNAKTKQDDLLKNQQVSKHVLILTWKVDEFWSEISKIEFQYLSTPNLVTYTYDITHLLDQNVEIVEGTDPSPSSPSTPQIGLKKALKDQEKRNSLS